MNPFLFYAKMQFISALEQRYKAEKRMKSELKDSIDYFKQKRGLTQIYADSMFNLRKFALIRVI
ncbi:hypothetical protein BANORC5_00840 [Bacteroides nordii]|nr:hypothetical protein BANORC5_00840 [Bacteroides nordii]